MVDQELHQWCCDVSGKRGQERVWSVGYAVSHQLTFQTCRWRNRGERIKAKTPPYMRQKFQRDDIHKYMYPVVIRRVACSEQRCTCSGCLRHWRPEKFRRMVKSCRHQVREKCSLPIFLNSRDPKYGPGWEITPGMEAASNTKDGLMATLVMRKSSAFKARAFVCFGLSQCSL